MKGMPGLYVQGIAGKMLRLKQLLPSANVSQLVAGCPALLLSYDVSTLEANLGKLRCGPQRQSYNIMAVAFSIM